MSVVGKAKLAQLKATAKAAHDRYWAMSPEERIAEGDRNEELRAAAEDKREAEYTERLITFLAKLGIRETWCAPRTHEWFGFEACADLACEMDWGDAHDGVTKAGYAFTWMPDLRLRYLGVIEGAEGLDVEVLIYRAPTFSVLVEQTGALARVNYAGDQNDFERAGVLFKLWGPDWFG